MRKLIASEPEVYEKLVPEKKALSDLDQKMHKILISNRPDSKKITLYNEAFQKSKVFLKKIQPKTSARKPLFENAVLKQYKKRVRAKKLLHKQMLHFLSTRCCAIFCSATSRLLPTTPIRRASDTSRNETNVSN